MARRLILVILLIAALGYAVYTYWPLVSPYFLKPAVVKPMPKEIKEKPAVRPAEPAREAEKEKVELALEKRIYREAKQLVDPFVLRVAARSKTKVKDKAKPTEKKVVKKPAEPRLEGIWVGADLKAAFISGSVMTEGGIIMGWRVASISPTKVVLRKGKRSKILRLEVR